MQLKAHFINNAKGINVLTHKAQQGPISPDLARVASTLEIAQGGTSRAAQIDQIFTRLIESASSGNGFDVEQLRQGKAAAMEEARFEDTNGFALKVNARSKALYATAQAGALRPFSFDSKDDALNFAKSTLSKLTEFANTINRSGGGDPTVGGGYSGLTFEPVEGYDDFNKVMQQSVESRKDNLEASRMLLFVESEMLRETFGIEEPIYEIKDGQVHIKSFEIIYQGEEIARSLSGVVSEYNGSGTLKLDKKL